MIGLTDASVSFGSRTLFSGITFNVTVGRSLVVLGPNGRGKTTLLRALLGFQSLTSGSRQAPKVAGYVPQNGTSQVKLTGLEVTVMGRAARLGLFGQPSAQDRAAAEAALVGVGAGHLAALRYDRMSGGQRQLVLIARALATGSSALVFDEPTSALDLGNQSRTLELLNTLRLRRDKAILFTTHDPNHALAASDEVLLMMPGGREVQGTVDEMIEPGHLSELYGVPMRWVEVRGPTGEPRRAILPAFAGIRYHMSAIYLKSAFAEPCGIVREAASRGVVTVVEQTDLTLDILLAHKGLITENQLDQNAMLAMKDALCAFLDAGGRWFFNGHFVRPLVDGAAQYRAIAEPRRIDFDLSSINPHPLYDGIDLKKLEASNGVAGFFGRGCNPLPDGAVAINGLGTARVPVDWVWARPDGGRIFSHAGNDLSSIGVEWNLAPELMRRILDWADGGACLDPWPASPATPAASLPLATAENYRGMRVSSRTRRRIVTPTCGTYYNVRSLEGPRHTAFFDVICAPEQLAEVVNPDDILFVPCRTPASRMITCKEVILRHLQAGGTVVALGESRSDLWLPAIEFTVTPTNWWWWLDPAADLGVRVTGAAGYHRLMRGIGDMDVTWHLHGWFVPPEGATVLARDGEGRAIFYEDKVSTPGTMILSSLDPMFHHGSHFMPATTRFLDKFEDLFQNKAPSSRDARICAPLRPRMTPQIDRHPGSSNGARPPTPSSSGSTRGSLPE